MLRTISLLAALSIASSWAGAGLPEAAQRSSAPSTADPEADELGLLSGSVFLAGEGEPGPAVRSAFVDLAGGGAARIVVLAQGTREGMAIDWIAAGARAHEVVTVRRGKDLADAKDLALLFAADGLWLTDLSEAVSRDPLLRALLVNALERGAAVGAGGELARALTGVPGVDGDRMCLVPRVELLAAPAGGDEDAAQRASELIPARIVVAVPEGAAIAVHQGRRVALLGAGVVAFAIKRKGGELVREQVLAAQEQRDHGDPLEYRLDFLSWVHSARGAGRPPFPPEAGGEAQLERGALLLHGGGGVGEATWERFIELAGGTDARIVCIPSAGQDDEGQAPNSYSARELTQRGCTGVSVVHAAQRRRTNHDGLLLEALEAADAVWIDGGRTFRFMDRFGETRAAAAIAGVLERGGIVAGSSAGAQVLGAFLLRGNPKTNTDITDPGYRVALGLLKGVVIDAHFRDRERGPQLARLVRDFPQLLGLGVDGETALLVQGTIGEVLGEAGVVVYDRRDGDEPPEAGLVLEPGARFDLVRGVVVD